MPLVSDLPRRRAPSTCPTSWLRFLDADPELAEAFHALTLGRQRSYVIAFSSAKTSATRVARIAKSRSKMIAGKGAMER
jgi:uncharacterized protein YdeI (YjbR/CyaY-like superfamily)